MSEPRREFLAHSQSPTGRKDLLRDHLESVSALAGRYAEALEAAAEAKLAGLLHDLGKYGDLFQRRLQRKEHGVDHWSLGAWVALSRYKRVAAALAIQGHHTGLQDASKDALCSLRPEKLAERHPAGLRLSEQRIETLLERLQADGIRLPPEGTDPPGAEYQYRYLYPAAWMLDVRMLFAALVDADFIETEAHFDAPSPEEKGYREPGPPLEAEPALRALLEYTGALSEQSEASDEVNAVRRDLLESCLEAAASRPGLFTLTAPTGAGKTLGMLAFALRHAAEHNMRRVITVIPYLTIIEQTAQVYREALGRYLEGKDPGIYILEHHSLAHGEKDDSSRSNRNRTQDMDMEREGIRRARVLAENWDAPIIVTTSVQFFESLFANRPAPCRKLHRLARSVILFDEVQTLPRELAIPTLATLSRLTERYGATVVFATATQPAFTSLDDSVRRYCPAGWTPREIVPPEKKLFGRARRTRTEWPDLQHPVSWVDLAEALAGHQQVLCVVNMKRHALRLFDELKERGSEGLFHLSTNMCPAHRKKALEEVRRRLAEGAPCRLVSTQCVEAGVDLDFPIVYRAMGPLEAIAQAAGRCNRNGRMKLGTVRVFVPKKEPGEKSLYPDGAYSQAAQVTGTLLRSGDPATLDIDDPGLFEKYYRELYEIAQPEKHRPELQDAIRRGSFVEVAKHYRLIAQDTINVLVPYDERAFRCLAAEVGKTGLTRLWIRRAREHAVSLFRPDPRKDPVANYLDPVPLVPESRFPEKSEEWFIYLEPSHYDREVGLRPPEKTECLIG